MKWNRAFAGVLGALPVVALLGFGMTRDPKEIASPLPGRQAPDFALATFTGVPPGQRLDTARLAKYAGDVVVINYWASWCLACRGEHPVLQMVGSAFRDTADVHFFGVLYNDTPQNGRRWLAEMGGDSYPSLLDPGSRTAIDYGVYGVPETYFIGRDGRVAYKHTGPVTEDLLLRKIAELRAASPSSDSARSGKVPDKNVRGTP